MEYGCGIGCWSLAGGGWVAGGRRDGAWLWDGELVAGRRRVGGWREKGWSMAVVWGVGGWEEEGRWPEGREMEHGCGMGSWWLGEGALVA